MNGSSYLSRLFEITGSTEIIDGFGASMDFNTGISNIINILVEQIKSGRKIMFIGNGGSAAIASHGALDFWKNGKMRALSFNEGTLLTCIGNDYGYSHVFEKPIGMFADPGDVLIAISSSGKSENILLGVEEARRLGCKIVTLSGFSSDNPLRTRGDMNIYVPSQSYGFVELIHQIVIHMILDIIMECNNQEGILD